MNTDIKILYDYLSRDNWSVIEFQNINRTYTIKGHCKCKCELDENTLTVFHKNPHIYHATSSSILITQDEDFVFISILKYPKKENKPIIWTTQNVATNIHQKMGFIKDWKYFFYSHLEG